jgi:hypothetical protein
MIDDALHRMDATIHAAMLAVGIADTGTYEFGDADPVPCRFYDDEEQQEFGDQDAVAGSRRTLGIFLADVPDPKKGAVVTIDNLQWKLQKRVSVDQSISRWVVACG